MSLRTPENNHGGASLLTTRPGARIDLDKGTCKKVLILVVGKRGGGKGLTTKKKENKLRKKM